MCITWNRVDVLGVWCQVNSWLWWLSVIRWIEITCEVRHLAMRFIACKQRNVTGSNSKICNGIAMKSIRPNPICQQMTFAKEQGYCNLDHAEVKGMSGSVTYSVVSGSALVSRPIGLSPNRGRHRGLQESAIRRMHFDPKHSPCSLLGTGTGCHCLESKDLVRIQVFKPGIFIAG